MPPKQRKGPKPPRVIGSLDDPDGFGVWVRRYLEWLAVRNYSPRTVTNAESSLGLFVTWCSTRSLVRPSELTKPILERYQRHLYHQRRPDGRPQLSFRSQHVRLSAVRGFFRWLVKQNALSANPASELELPRLPMRLPRDVLTVSEVERVMEQPDTRTAVGVRDRAILEVLYSTGIRRSEVVGLRLSDVDAERGTILVREGKGLKDRMVPVGERALAWVHRYARDVRPELMMPPDPGALFLTTLGEQITPDWLTQAVRRYVKDSEIGKQGACHIFRHTMATLMLEGGADVRYIQEMLGHVHLDSTQVYTRVSIRKLKAIHEATHPGAKLERLAKTTGTRETPQETTMPEPHAARSAVASQPATAEKSSSPLAADLHREDSE
jgi:integrase/recombinase XerD